jgi:hypothetical protein
MTSTQTAEPTGKMPKFNLGHGGGMDGQLIIPSAVAMPVPVRKANTIAESAIADARLAAVQLRAAGAAVDQAKAVDRAADRAAVTAGEPLPTGEQKAEPAAVAAAELAQRRDDAARANANDACIVLCRAITSEHAAWLPAAEQTAAKIEAEALAALDALVELADRLAVQRTTVEGLRNWPTHGGPVSGKGIAPMPSERVKQIREDVLKRMDHADEQYSRRDTVTRDLPALIGAIKRELTGRHDRITAGPPPAPAPLGRAAWAD